MMKLIRDNFHDLLTDEKKAFLYLATINGDGTPQVTPVWFNTEGDFILINTARGRVKDRNMRIHPQIALCIADPGNSYRYIQIQGKVVEVTEDGADAHIDALMYKYHGENHYPYRAPGEVRVRYKIQIQKVDAHG
jgi:PPOX class probable F420-dependent enzyme